jgi:hypothetical protein
MEHLPPRLINPALRKRKGSNYLLLRTQEDYVTITAIRANGAIHQNLVVHIEELAAIAEGAVPRESLEALLVPSAKPSQFAGFEGRLMVPSGLGARAKAESDAPYDASEVKAELEATIKRPIPDEAWEELRRDELVADVMIDPAAMRALVRKARKLVPAPVKVVKKRSSGKGRAAARKKSREEVGNDLNSEGRARRPSSSGDDEGGAYD